MKLTYQTATVTFIQFIAMVVLGLVNAVVSIISTCHNNQTSGNCINNMVSSTALFLLTPVWFGLILAAGYFAQKNRSNRLAGILIFLELITLVVAGHFNLPRESGFLTKSTSLLDVVLAIIAIYLAVQLLLARGHRIVKGSRRRKSAP